MNGSNLFVLVAALAMTGAAHSEVVDASTFPDLALPATGLPGQIVVITNDLDGATQTRHWLWVTSGRSPSWERLDDGEHNVSGGTAPDHAQDSDYNTGVGDGPDMSQGSDYDAGLSGGTTEAEDPGHMQAFEFPDLTLPSIGVPGQVLTISSCVASVRLTQRWLWGSDGETGGWQLVANTDEENYSPGTDGRQNNADVPSNICE